jgi:hypothetical protein
MINEMLPRKEKLKVIYFYRTLDKEWDLDLVLLMAALGNND